MRNMSFMLTTEQIKNRTKTVTRRVGWKFIKVGNLIQAIEKGQGLKKGETVKKLAVLRVEGVRVEPLWYMGHDDVIREGFPELSVIGFIDMFCKSHKGCTPETEVTRILFSYVEPHQVAEFERRDKEAAEFEKWGDRLIASGAVKFIEF